MTGASRCSKMELPIFSPPQHGESFSSYLIRLSELNCYPSLTWIPRVLGCKDFAFRLRQIAQLAHQMENIWGGERNIFLNTAFGYDMTRRNSVILPGGQIINVRHFQIGALRYCPECLKEYGFFQRVWEVRAVTVCPRHQKLLLDRCLDCGRGLSRNRPCLLRCQQCGAFLHEGCAPKASEKAGLLARLLCSKMATPFLCQPVDTLPVPWGTLNLAELVAGISYLDRFHWTRTVNDKARLKVDGRLIEKNVIPIILGWPDSFHDLLARICLRRRSQGLARSDGIQDALGGAYFALIDSTRTHLDFMFHELARFAEASPNQCLVTARGGSKIYEPTKIRYLTKADTCKVLGIGHDTFDMLIRQGYLHSEPVKFGRQIAHRVSIFEVGALRRRVRWSVPVAEAAHTLGLSRRQVAKELIDRRLEPVLGLCHAGPLGRRVSSRSMKSYVKAREEGRPYRIWAEDI